MLLNVSPPPLRGITRTAPVILTFTLLILAIVALQTVRFRDHDYCEDEINTIHAARILDTAEVVRWMGSVGVHPAGWRVIATSWIDAFGMHPAVVRYLSTLFTLLTLALLFRLGADLFDHRVGLIAVLMMGILPFFQFFAHELRPYPALTFATAGLMLFCLRWLRHQNFMNALLYVGMGVFALQTHYFAGYIIAAQAVTLLILLRPDRARFVRAAGLFVAIGLSFVPWLLPLAHGALVTNSRGINYSVPSN